MGLDSDALNTTHSKGTFGEHFSLQLVTRNTSSQTGITTSRVIEPINWTCFPSQGLKHKHRIPLRDWYNLYWAICFRQFPQLLLNGFENLGINFRRSRWSLVSSSCRGMSTNLICSSMAWGWTWSSATTGVIATHKVDKLEPMLVLNVSSFSIHTFLVNSFMFGA